LKKTFIYLSIYLFVFFFLEATVFVYLDDIKSSREESSLNKSIETLDSQYNTFLDSFYKNLKANFEIQKAYLLNKSNRDKENVKEDINSLCQKLTVDIVDLKISIFDQKYSLNDKQIEAEKIYIRKTDNFTLNFEANSEFKGYRYTFDIEHKNQKVGKVEYLVSFDALKQKFAELYKKKISLLINKHYYTDKDAQEFYKKYVYFDDSLSSINSVKLKYRDIQLVNTNISLATNLVLDDKLNLTFTLLKIENLNAKDIGYIVYFSNNTLVSDLKYQFKVNIVVSSLFFIIFMVAIFLINKNREKTLELKELLEKRVEKSDTELRLLDDYKKAVDISNVVSKSDLEGNIIYANDKFCEITGYSREEILGKNFNILRHPDSSDKLFEDLWKTILNKKVWKGVIKNQHKDGTGYVVDSTIIPILNEENEIIEFITIRHDITELIRKDEKIKSQTTHSQTGLFNRVKLVEDIEASTNPSLAIINIDSFSEINNLYGSDIGDMILIELSRRFEKLVKDTDFEVYKLNADEFAVLCKDCSDYEKRYLEFIKDLTDTLNEKHFIFKDQEIHFTITIGIAYGKDKLLIKAGKAYKEAKNSKKHFLFYSDNIDGTQKYEDNLKWLKELKNAFEKDGIVAFYQPIINNENGEVEKYESLVRLIDSKENIKSPFFFLDVAKRAKLYPKITQTMIEKSFENFADKEFDFSINFSVEDILNKDTIALLKSKLTDRAVAKRVVLEIVESEGIENFKDVAEFITEMKELGCKIAIDDFGTGYSNFQYLASLNVDFIKIDGSLIKNIDNDKTLEVITRTIIDFAKQLNIKTVAEFVHSDSVLAKVKELGIDYSQGYLLGEPKDKTL